MAAKNQIATVEKTAGDFLKGLQGTLQTYAVRSYKEDTFIKSAMIAVISNDSLQKCLNTDDGKASMVNAMRMAAGTGLSLNPQEGKAALIAYSGKASYQVMKNGLIELALESGKVEFVTSDTVRENDEFVIAKTMNGDEYEFRPARKSRGEIDGFFAAVKMKAESPESIGVCHVKYMTMEEITAHRKEFSPRTQMPQEGYGQKTILKKLLNGVHISPEISNAIGAENQREEIDVTPPPALKGTSADDLAEKLKSQGNTDTTDAEIVPEGDQTEDKTEEQPGLDMGQNSKTNHDTPI